MRKALLMRIIALVLIGGWRPVSAADWHENPEDSFMDGAVRVKTWTFKDVRNLEIRCFKASGADTGRYDLRYSIEVPLLSRIAPDLEKRGQIRLVASADGVPLGTFNAQVVKHDFGISFLASLAPSDVDKLAAATKKLSVVPRQENEPLDNITEFGVDGLVQYLAPVNAACETTRAEIKTQEKAASNGDADAMIALGNLYYYGTLLPKDISKALDWYEKAAATGSTGAMSALGDIFFLGQELPRDLAKARAWYEKGAAKNDAEAMANLGNLYQDSANPSQDLAKAREWFEKAAAENNVAAMISLGELYGEGKGVRQDFARSRQWYEKAVSKGAPSAAQALENLKVTEAESGGNFIEAVRLQAAIVDRTEAAELKELGRAGPETANALNTLAWDALFAKDFTKARESAGKAVAIDAKDLVFAMNFAHAKMFLGEKEDAEKIYLSHRGEKLSTNTSELWENVIAEDFRKLRKAGLNDPLMRQIETRLGISKKEQ